MLCMLCSRYLFPQIRVLISDILMVIHIIKFFIYIFNAHLFISLSTEYMEPKMRYYLH
ncbi:hypothetical protein GLOIN_2v1667511 [Rhizophagus irregularis DAOM 181602=DAOM 197198]|uniref:Uncharacterized protein n=1 Tax=Rhizophagus irregularis (strain DAOM 181602 / DAOM 197198 / MUCL 43194) TaxID=747089 RepID=A0A2P4PIV1_RHIID|nr:hypothetical protein GLOIN_2v1667511 [Rhizophagus irregularis DAOM 181602=DAOM 197198]POG65298.1 hypothetical protein GLOIN_2v1667511 [Rhizophagus irregularis DAOM 181602=DAOM 197198]|eukprot:XP_025172164.1 hypothetical protein GLOIN_2v1667511 [Rhizophagus irregularis DAOM 181602=DAOM 197198]